MVVGGVHPPPPQQVRRIAELAKALASCGALAISIALLDTERDVTIGWTAVSIAAGAAAIAVAHVEHERAAAAQQPRRPSCFRRSEFCTRTGSS